MASAGPAITSSVALKPNRKARRCHHGFHILRIAILDLKDGLKEVTAALLRLALPGGRDEMLQKSWPFV
jgi:hypothetical protein